jgi:hypothetical protein
MQTREPDRLNLRIWTVIAILGAVLCVIGWYRYVS